MTLTELRYVVAVAREKHFGRAADACFVSQPTLSVGIKKLEEGLGVAIFERNSNEIALTAVGEKIVSLAVLMLEQANNIRMIAEQNSDPLSQPLRIGAIQTIGPYLFPRTLPLLNKLAPKMQLIIQENYFSQLREKLKHGQLDVIVVSLPFAEPGIMTQSVYDEPFQLMLPPNHAWAQKSTITPKSLGNEIALLLDKGHCFRDQVLKAFPQLGHHQTSSGNQQTIDSSSLETIRHMVESGTGMAVLPASACISARNESQMSTYKPFTIPSPSRRVGLAWRKSFPRMQAIEAFRKAILSANLTGVTMLNLPANEC